MASSIMAQMLDELMGKDRDLLPNEESRHKGFDDPEVCKPYLCGFCPHDLFTNTKFDLGACPLIHDDALVAMYKRSPKFKKLGYEEEFLKFLQSIKNDCDKRIKRGIQRLAQAPNQNLGNPKTSSIQILENKITSLLERVEALGSEGKVEEAQEQMKEIDRLRKEQENIQSHILSDNPNEKQMEVCSTCGAFLIVGDAQSRVDDHLKGKQHKGFAQVRDAIKQLRADLYNIHEDDEGNEAGSPRRRSVSRSHRRRDDSQSKSRDAVVERKRSRSRSNKKRSDREVRRSRSRDRANNRRDRSRSRKRERSRRRSRDRRRSRSRDKKSRRDSPKRSKRSSRSKSRDRRRRHSSGQGERIEIKVEQDRD